MLVFRELLRKLWSDTRGGLLTLELVLLTSITTLGVASGLVEMRDSVNSGLANVGQVVNSMTMDVNGTGSNATITAHEEPGN